MRTKKALALLISVFLIFSFTSCREFNPSNKASKEAVKYFEYLKNKDVDKLIDLFTDDVRDTYDLEKEWEEFFASIDGNIVSYERIRSGGEEERIDKGQTSFYSVNIKYENVETDTGKTYKCITFSQVRADKKNPGNKGIRLFSVELPADNEKGFEEKIVGGFIDYTYGVSQNETPHLRCFMIIFSRKADGLCFHLVCVPESVPVLGTICCTFGLFWPICPSKCPYHRDHLLYIWVKSAYLSLKASLL